MSPRGSLVDSHGRVLRDLRVSVTDRCNFRCLYCLPETEAAANFYQNRFATQSGNRLTRTWTPRSELLSFEEIENFVRLAVALGISKIRLTGGEPLLRKDIETLVAKIAAIPGVEDLAITTNGFHFAEVAHYLKYAGLKRVTFSLDSLDRANFIRITGRDGLDSVLNSIRLAQEMGFSPVKVNAVIIRGLNDQEIPALAEFGLKNNLAMRFIEFMPLDSKRAWEKEAVVPAREILQSLQQSFSLEPVASSNSSETARRWRHVNSSAEIGIIAPVSEPFCGHCNRLRLTADGQIRTCLFSIREHNLKKVMRSGASDEQISNFLFDAVKTKERGHNIGREDFVPPKRSMSCIGG